MMMDPEKEFRAISGKLPIPAQRMAVNRLRIKKAVPWFSRNGLHFFRRQMPIDKSSVKIGFQKSKPAPS
jgi:hypothetical protein